MQLLVFCLILALYVCLGYIAATVVLYFALQLHFEVRRTFVGITALGILLCTGFLSGQRTVAHPGSKLFFGFIYSSFVGGLVFKLGRDHSI